MDRLTYSFQMLGMGALALTGLLIAPAAFAGDATFTADTPVALSGNGINLTILAGSDADSVAVAATTVTVTAGAGDTFSIRAPNGNRMNNDGGLTACSPVATPTLTIVGPATVVITPSLTECSGGSSSGGGGGGGGIIVTSTACTLTSPNGGETFTGGEPTNITWSSTGTGINNVALFYSVDDGMNWGIIAAPEDNDGTYTWNVANTGTSQARVRVDCRDSGGGTLSSDQSDTAFTIQLTGELPPAPAPAPAPAGTMPRDQANAQLPSGYSVDYLVKLPDDGNPDTWSDSTVYYLGLDAKRHPFPSAQIYFTWYTDFSAVRVIDAATIAMIPLGTPVLVRPGTSWVKIQSTVETYWVEPGSYVLRWIQDEATARALGGDDWNQNILDIEPTYFTRFTVGSPIALADLSADWPEGALVKSPTDALIWYVTETGRRQITGTDAFNANKFLSRFVETNNASGWQALPTETPITGFEDALFSLQH